MTPWMAAYLWRDGPFLEEHYRTGVAPATRLDAPGVLEAVTAVQAR